MSVVPRPAAVRAHASAQSVEHADDLQLGQVRVVAMAT
jgi:hypothetical protein